MLRKINIPSLAHPLAWQPGLGGEFLCLEFKIRLGHRWDPFFTSRGLKVSVWKSACLVFRS